MVGYRGDSRPRVGLTISIDTEEDNWVPSQENITVRNIGELPIVAGLFARLGVRATYFTTYQVAVNPDASAVLREMSKMVGVEIGAHLHPWNTPPFCGLEPTVSMVSSYPPEIQLGKVERLLDVIHSELHVEPSSFRAGRFGIGSSTIQVLIRSGLLVDSSVTPLVSWKKSGGPSFLGARSEVYRMSGAGDVCSPSLSGELVEVPITVGYTRFRPSSWGWMARLLDAPYARRLRIAGMASRMRLVRRVILSPETNSADDMNRVTRRMLKGGNRHLHMYLHSSSLTPGLTPFVQSAAQLQRLYDRIERYVEALTESAEVTFCTVSEAAKLYAPEWSSK